MASQLRRSVSEIVALARRASGTPLGVDFESD